MKHLPPMALLLAGVTPACERGCVCLMLAGQPAPVSGSRMNHYIFNPQTPLV